MNLYIAVFIGGGLGSMTRFGIGKIINSNFEGINPVAILVSNILATIILGLVVIGLQHKITISPLIKSLIVTGFCGGFSTFSTFSYETYKLFETGNTIYAIGNVLVSVVLGVFVLYSIAKIA